MENNTLLSLDSCTAQQQQTPFFWDYSDEPAPERYNQSGFYWSKGQWVGVASADAKIITG